MKKLSILTSINNTSKLIHDLNCLSRISDLSNTQKLAFSANQLSFSSDSGFCIITAMQVYRRMDMVEMEAKLGSVDTRANAALALAIILLMAQIIMAIFLFKVWLNARESRREADPERGLELQPTSRGMPTNTAPVQNTVPRRPQNAHVAAPVGPSSTQARGRPVAAYDRGDIRGENEDYYNPSPISRKPTWTADSGLGQQTHGADYTQQRRQGRFEDGHKTNRNDADYGRKGNKFAHGT